MNLVKLEFTFARRTPGIINPRMNAKANTYFRGYSARSCKLEEQIPRAFSPRKFIKTLIKFESGSASSNLFTKGKGEY